MILKLLIAWVLNCISKQIQKKSNCFQGAKHMPYLFPNADCYYQLVTDLYLHLWKPGQFQVRKGHASSYV